MPYYGSEEDEEPSKYGARAKYTANPRDRQPGLLTYDDREYLFGEKDLEDVVEIQLRQRLRDRIRNGLLDFELLLAHLDEQDIATIFGDIAPPPNPNKGVEIYHGVNFAIAFFYYAISTNASTNLEDIIENAIRQASLYREHKDSRGNSMVAEASVNIDVKWDIWEVDHEAARQKLRANEELSDREIADLIRHADLTDEEWELLRSISDE